MDYTSPGKYFQEILHPNVGCRCSSKYLLDAGFHNETNTNTHTMLRRLSPTMKAGNIAGWKVAVGDKVHLSHILCACARTYTENAHIHTPNALLSDLKHGGTQTQTCVLVHCTKIIPHVCVRVCARVRMCVSVHHFEDQRILIGRSRRSLV